MNIEEIINSALTRMRQEQELRRIALLELLYKNIDYLIENSNVWFGDNIPPDFKRIIRSFMIISTSFLGDEYDFSQMVFDNPVEEVPITEIVNEIVRETGSLDENRHISVSFEMATTSVMTSRKKFKNSLITIFLAFMVFMDKRSKCMITVTEDRSSVVMNILFSDLLESFPGLDKIQKAFFPYVSGDDYRIGIGIDFALYTLRNIGAVVKVFSTAYGDTSAGITITFPSMEFQNVLKEIRSTESADIRKKGDGLVLLLTDDLTLEMVIGEMLNEYGYRIKKVDLSDLENPEKWTCKAVIADHIYLSRKKVDPIRFRDTVSAYPRTILIHGTDAAIGEFLAPGVVPLIKPFSLDTIASALEGDCISSEDKP